MSQRAAFAELDLESLLEQVRSGAAIGSIEKQVASFDETYAAGSPANTADADGFRQRLERLSQSLDRFIEAAFQDNQPARIIDFARVGSAAARLLSDRAAADLNAIVGRRLDELGDHSAAAGRLQRAVQFFGVRPETVTAAVRCLDAWKDALDHDAIEREAPRIIAMARAFGDAAAVARALASWSVSEEHENRLAQAKLHVRDLLTVMESIAPEERSRLELPVRFNCLGFLGRIARAEGRYDDALELLEQARKEALAAGAVESAAFHLSETGFTWSLAGDFERGERVLEEASSEASRLGMPDWAERWTRRVGSEQPLGMTTELESPATRLGRAVRLINLPEQRETARAMLLAVIDEARADGERVLEAHARTVLAGLYDSEGKLLLAETAIQAAIALASALGDPGMEFRFRTNLANILLRRGQGEAGVAELERAIVLGEQLRGQQGAMELRQTLGAGLSRAYDQLAFNFVLNYRNPDGSSRPPQPEKLFQLGQRARAVNLSHWLTLGEAVERGGSTDAIARLLDLRGAEVALEAVADEGRSLGPASRSRDEAAERFALIVAPAIAASMKPPILSFVELTGALAPGEYVVDLLSLREGVSINVYGRGGPLEVYFAPGHREDRVAAIEAWSITQRAAARAILHGGEQTAEFARFQERVKRLGELVLGPMAIALKQAVDLRRILVVPHRELFLIPFWRLAADFPAVSVMVLPSSTALVLLRRRERSLAGSRAYCGDPTATLPYALREKGSLKADVSLEPRPKLLRDRLPEMSIAHFATHGHFDRQHPYRSGLVGSKPDEDGTDPLNQIDPWEQSYELLTIPWIIARLHLPRCNLAVLSACDSGLPREHPASEFTSLPAAFLVAGARNVVASLWPVHDGAAALLMSEFYAGVLGEERLPPSSALARARQRLGATTRDEVLELGIDERIVPPGLHPFASSIFTDAFQLYGVD